MITTHVINTYLLICCNLTNIFSRHIWLKKITYSPSFHIRAYPEADPQTLTYLKNLHIVQLNRIRLGACSELLGHQQFSALTHADTTHNSKTWAVQINKIRLYKFGSLRRRLPPLAFVKAFPAHACIQEKMPVFEQTVKSRRWLLGWIINPFSFPFAIERLP